jgi:hypothetical protein
VFKAIWLQDDYFELKREAADNSMTEYDFSCFTVLLEVRDGPDGINMFHLKQEKTTACTK